MSDRFTLIIKESKTLLLYLEPWDGRQSERADFIDFVPQISTSEPYLIVVCGARR